MRVLMEVGEDGAGSMRRAEESEDVLSWARLMVNRPFSYWGSGRGDELRRLSPVEQNSLFREEDGVDVLDAVAIDGEPAVWVLAEVADGTVEVGGRGLNPNVEFEEGLP